MINNYPYNLLVKVHYKHGCSVPKVLRTDEELVKFVSSHGRNGDKLEFAVDPRSNEELREKIENSKDLYPDPEVVVNTIMENYDGHCTDPGYPPLYYYANGDPGYPGEGPSYENLPDEDMFRDDVIEEWSDQLLKSLGVEDGIYSMKLSSDDRDLVEEIADEEYTEVCGHWPSSEEIIDRYAVEDEEPEPDPYYYEERDY